MHITSTKFGWTTTLVSPIQNLGDCWPPVPPPPMGGIDSCARNLYTGLHHKDRWTPWIRGQVLQTFKILPFSRTIHYFHSGSYFHYEIWKTFLSVSISNDSRTVTKTVHVFGTRESFGRFCQSLYSFFFHAYWDYLLTRSCQWRECEWSVVVLL